MIQRQECGWRDGASLGAARWDSCAILRAHSERFPLRGQGAHPTMQAEECLRGSGGNHQLAHSCGDRAGSNGVVHHHARLPPAAGFTHSAFTFAHESLVARSVVADADVPPGALISFMQKGLQYVEIESHLQEDGSERQCDEPFFLLAPHVCRVKSLYSAGGKGRGGGELSSGWEGSGTANGGGVGGPGGSIEVPPSDVTLLVGHKREVFVAAFHPTADILATGSGDGTARLWRLDAAAGGGDPPCTVLQHSTTGGDGRKGGGAGGKDKTQDVAALDWSPDGSRLATGMYDGRARIWSLDGALQSVLTGHTSAVFSIQWSPAGQFVLTGSGEGDLTSHRNNSHVVIAAWLFLQHRARAPSLLYYYRHRNLIAHALYALPPAADKSVITAIS